MFTFDNHRWEVDLIGFSFLAIAVGRALNIYVISALLNIRRKPKIPVNFMNMLMFSGEYFDSFLPNCREDKSIFPST